MPYLSPTTVAIAGETMAEAMNQSWTEDRADVLKYINKYRNLLFNSYTKFKLFDNAFHCIQVAEFTQVCASCCPATYRGFTLPNDMEAVEAVYAYGQPLTIHSRWRESHIGIVDSSRTISGSLLMAEQFPTERDLNAVTKIKIYTEHADDENKFVYVEAIDSANKRVKICFKLIGNGFAVSRQKIKKILSVSLPPERKGSLILSQSDNYDLSIYDPWESIPQYRRYKLPDHCSEYTVLVQGTKRFRKVYFDHDIVEVGDELVIDSAAKFFKFGDTGTDNKEIGRATYDLNNMEKYLASLQARQIGNAKQDGSPFRGRPITKSTRLPGYR